MSIYREQLARGEFANALGPLREAVRRRYAGGELPPGKRFPSFVFSCAPATAQDEEPEEDLFALAMWESGQPAAELASDVLLLERAVLLSSSQQQLGFSTLAAWLALRTRPGQAAAELEEGRKLVELYLAPCLKAAEDSAGAGAQAGEMYIRLVEILVLSDAMSVEAAAQFVDKNAASLGDRAKASLDQRLALRAAAAAASSQKKKKEEKSTAPAQQQAVEDMVGEFQRLHPSTTPAAAASAPSTPATTTTTNNNNKPPQQPHDLIELQKRQALLAAASFASLLLLYLSIRFRQKIASSLLSLGDVVFGGQ